MAIDFIPITQTAPQGSQLKTAILSLRQAYSQLQAVLGIMTHQNDGTTFTGIESAFGLPAGKGQTVFNLVNGTVGAMQGTFQNNNAQTITEQVG